VGLVMIVKNEAAILPRLADSVRDHIDYWTIVDTGSTDETIGVIDRIFTPVPGQVLSHTFNGYGPSRTLALRAAEPHSDWMLMLDADDTLHGEIGPLGTEADSIEAEVRSGDLSWWLPKLLRSNQGWESRGRAHEYYASATAGAQIRTTSFWIEHHGDGSGRSQKFERELGLLQADWEEDPANERTAFYMARTYDDAGDAAQAIDWYRRRLAMGGWDEENFYARYRLGACLIYLGAGEEGCGHLWEAWGMQPERAEPLVALAEHYRLVQQWALAYLVADLAFSYCRAQPGNKLPAHTGLFVDVSAAGWRIAYEQSISAWYAGHKERGHVLSDWLAGVVLPEPYAASAQANSEFYA
jgi:glycosyltransferase involved in cell wall biosynthesis